MGNPLVSPEVYAYMQSYSPYENIAEVDYPAILAATSLNDVRVSFIEPTKWVAQLRAKTLNYRHETTPNPAVDTPTADSAAAEVPDTAEVLDTAEMPMLGVQRPILLKTELAAGHAGGSGRYQRWENRAGEYAFVLDQLGLG
ncbi:prolyl oligopeptidase family serine peptidase [Arcanobacterium hippocoleae]